MNNSWKKGFIATALINLLLFLIAAALLGYSVTQFILGHSTDESNEQYSFIAFDKQGNPISAKISLDQVNPTDIDQVPWASDALSDLTALGILKKDKYGRIQPKNNITRKELAVIISEIRDLPVDDIEITEDIGDVDADDPLAPYVQAVIDAGIMEDIKEFNVYARKIDVVKAIIKMDGIPLSKKKKPVATSAMPFSDIEINSPDYPYIETAYQEGILVEATEINSNEDIDKATAAVLLSKSSFTQQKVDKMQEILPESQTMQDNVIVYGHQPDNSEPTDPLVITSPLSYTLIETNIVTIEGVTVITPVYINDKKVSVANDNVFQAEVKLEKGKNIIIIRNDRAKRIIYVQYDNNINNNVKQANSNEQALYLQNFDSFQQQPQDLQRSLTRAEAALIMTNISAKITKKYTKSQFTDLPANHYAFQALNDVVNKGYLTASSQKVYPEKPISYMEAIKAIVRFGKLKLPLHSNRIAFANVRGNSQSSRYLQAALNAGVIPQRSQKVDINKAITRQQFLIYLFNLEYAKNQLNLKLTQDNNLKVPRKVKTIIRPTLNKTTTTKPSSIITRSGESIITKGKIGELKRMINQTDKTNQPKKQQVYTSSKSTRYAQSLGYKKQQAKTNKQKKKDTITPAYNVTGLQVITPANNSRITSKIVTIKGVTNKSVVTINGSNYKVIGNRFSQEIELKIGKNGILISDGFKNINLRIIRLISYSDIKKLKRKKEIEYLATVGYFGNSDQFFPAAKVSRFELANICALVSGEKLSYSPKAPYKDVGYRDPAALSSYFLKQKEIVTGNYFYPKKTITITNASNWLNQIDKTITKKRSDSLLTRKDLIDLLVKSSNVKKQLKEKLF